MAATITEAVRTAALIRALRQVDFVINHGDDVVILNDVWQQMIDSGRGWNPWAADRRGVIIQNNKVRTLKDRQRGALAATVTDLAWLLERFGYIDAIVNEYLQAQGIQAPGPAAVEPLPEAPAAVEPLPEAPAAVEPLPEAPAAVELVPVHGHDAPGIVVAAPPVPHIGPGIPFAHVPDLGLDVAAPAPTTGLNLPISVGQWLRGPEFANAVVMNPPDDTVMRARIVGLFVTLPKRLVGQEFIWTLGHFRAIRFSSPQHDRQCFYDICGMVEVVRQPSVFVLARMLHASLGIAEHTRSLCRVMTTLLDVTDDDFIVAFNICYFFVSTLDVRSVVDIHHFFESFAPAVAANHQLPATFRGFYEHRKNFLGQWFTESMMQFGLGLSLEEIVPIWLGLVYEVDLLSAEGRNVVKKRFRALYLWWIYQMNMVHDVPTGPDVLYMVTHDTNKFTQDTFSTPLFATFFQMQQTI